ncbi:KR domain-containing protein [Sphingobium amiense]|uniref:KR domain-containing protein n=1 Tax=Sphingobium amiense TaxID=135719 RepID=A0A494W1E1_9SPHN|nr:SDR family NAD(P)-dependent oxidoreductase [Sphingobium amiense]BBD98424.1 KR domain-containing protein [Sphingobium amiense]
MDIRGQLAIISGGASGLGAATARAIAMAGGRVAILDRDPAAGRQVADATGGLFFDVDVASEAQVADAIAASADRHGPPRILVNAAGIVRDAEILDDAMTPASLKDFVDVVTTNLVGTFNCTRLFAAAAARSAPVGDGERGVVVNVASVAGLDSPSSLTAYSASKAGVGGMTLGSARSLAPWGIRVVAVAPGQFDTPILSVSGLSRAELQQQAAGWVPFPKRMGDPAEFAELVLAICRIPYINGDVIRIDGAGRAAFARAGVAGDGAIAS